MGTVVSGWIRTSHVPYPVVIASDDVPWNLAQGILHPQLQLTWALSVAFHSHLQMLTGVHVLVGREEPVFRRRRGRRA